MNRSQRREWRVGVFGHPELTPAQKLVLLALETYADYPEGTNARPGVALLAKSCALKARAVEAALQKGRQLDLIEQTGRANPKRALAACYSLVSTRTSVRLEDVSTRTSVQIEEAFQPARNEFQPARNGVSTRTSVQPTNPITPIQNTEGDARADLATEPRCDRHRDTANPPPCFACKQARLDAQNENEEQIRHADARREEIRREIDRCDECDDHGRRDDLTACDRHRNNLRKTTVP